MFLLSLLKTLFAINCLWEGWKHFISVVGSTEMTWNGAALFLEKSLCGAHASAPDKTMENAWSKKHHCFVNLSPVDGMFSLAGACVTSKFRHPECTALGWLCAICDWHQTHSWLNGQLNTIVLIIEAMHWLMQVLSKTMQWLFIALEKSFPCWCLSELDCPTDKQLTSASFQKELKKGFLCLALATAVSSNCPTELTCQLTDCLTEKPAASLANQLADQLANLLKGPNVCPQSFWQWINEMLSSCWCSLMEVCWKCSSGIQMDAKL